MRYGVLADIHANLFALRAAIDRLRREGVDVWLCAGDIIGYGPHPNECVETIAELGALCVAGNHELVVLGALSDQRGGRLARETMSWTRDVLREDCRAYLAELPCMVTATEIVMTHGSLNDPEEYVTRDAQAQGQLRQLGTEHPQASVLILGHTHCAWAYSQERGTIALLEGGAVPLLQPGRFMVNPGSVGQSRQREPVPRARFMLLDLEHRNAHFYSASYDVDACLNALHKHGLPSDCIQVHPGALATAQRRARRLLREAGRLKLIKRLTHPREVL